jgi:hypothetical protein
MVVVAGMEDFIFLVGIKTCELMGQIGWSGAYKHDTCYLLNVTKPMSLDIFRAQYIELGQKTCIVIACVLVVFAVLTMLRILEARIRSFPPPRVPKW